jgi:nicotinamidase-related amidase
MKRSLSVAPGKAAALFIDLQEEHRRDERYLVAGFEAVLANVRALQAAARQAGVPVFHAAYIADPVALRPFHPVMSDGSSAFSDRNSPLIALCPEVSPMGDEPTLFKSEPSVFGDGRLSRELAHRGIEWLFIAGVWTEACVDATVKDAISRGLRVILIKDACGSGSIAMHQTGILNLANRLYGGAVTNTRDACRVMAGEAGTAWMVEGSVPLRFTYENAADLYDGL